MILGNHSNEIGIIVETTQIQVIIILSRDVIQINTWIFWFFGFGIKSVGILFKNALDSLGSNI